MKLAILAYHKVDTVPPGAQYPGNYVLPEQFDSQLAALKRWGFRSIAFSQYLNFRSDQRSLPSRPIIITFDDGYRTTLTTAAPILRKYGFRATIFLVTDSIGQTNSWDPDEIQEPLLGAGEIREMQQDCFAFGSHTRSHVHLPALAPGAAEEQLTSAKAALGTLLGSEPAILAYPYAEHTEETRSLARKAGYRAAVGIRRRLNSERTDLFALNRIPVSLGTSIARFQWDLFRLRWRGE